MRRLSTWILVLALGAGGYGGWYWWSGRAAGVSESTLSRGLMPNHNGFKRLDADSETIQLLKSNPGAYVDIALKQSACPQITIPRSLPHHASAAYFGSGAGTLVEAIYSGSKSDVREVWQKVMESRRDCKTVTLPSGIGSFGFTMSPEGIAPLPRLIENPGQGAEGGMGALLGTDVGTALIGDEVIVTFIWIGGAELTGRGVKVRTHALRLLTDALGLPRTDGPGSPVPVG